MSLYTRVASPNNDWNKLASGLPSTSGIRDPAAKAVCDAIAQNLKYLVEKVKTIRVPDENLPRTDVSKRPVNYKP